MSVIKKKPVIEEILGRLTAAQLTMVKTAINSTTPEASKSLVVPSLAFTTLTAQSPTDIASYQVQLDHQKIRNGICIRILKDTVLYEHLLVYGESQKITIYELNTVKKEYKLIEEFCDINELRRVVEDGLITAGEIEITPEAISGAMEGSEFINVDINETDDKVQISLDQDAIDFLIPKEVPTAKITHTPDTANTLIQIDSGVFDVDNGYDLKVEIEGTGVHYGISTCVFPYNGSEAIVTTLLSINGTAEEVYSSMSANGVVNIIVPFVMTESETTTIFYKRSI